MNVRFINEHNEIVNEANEIMFVHDILSQKTLQSGKSVGSAGKLASMLEGDHRTILNSSGNVVGTGRTFLSTFL